MLAQSSDSAAAVLGILIAIAVIALQIYLIYAIIATRQDVQAIRRILGVEETKGGRVRNSRPGVTLRRRFRHRRRKSP